MRSRLGRITLHLAVIAGAIALWEWASATGRIRRNIFGQPSKIADTLRTWFDDGQLVSSTAATLREVALGMALGIAIGGIVGTAIGISEVLRDIAEPFIMFYNGMPRMMLLPVIEIPLGFYLASKVALVAMVTWVIVALSVAAGCAQIPPEWLSNSRLLGASRLQVARDVLAPAVALWVVASLRTTFQFAFASAVFAEFSGAPQGLGYLVVLGQQTFKINQVLAALLVVSALGVIGNLLLDRLERFAGRWRAVRA